MRAIAFIGAAVAILVLAGQAMSATPGTITVHASPYGTVLFDSRGFALYAFTRDTRGHSTCSAACAKAWPPYLVRGRLAAHGKLVSSIKRGDGTTQVTYAGRPLYHYVGEHQPHQILCQNIAEFGGVWLVVAPTGTLVR